MAPSLVKLAAVATVAFAVAAALLASGAAAERAADAKVTSRVFFDVSIDGQPAGRIGERIRDGRRCRASGGGDPRAARRWRAATTTAPRTDSIESFAGERSVGGGWPAARNGSAVLGLFGDVAPKTVENFRALAT